MTIRPQVFICVALAPALAGALAPGSPAQDAGPALHVEADLSAARALFEANLDAIRERDRDAYLAGYLQAPTLVRTGFSGPSLGYRGLEQGAGDAWPDVFEGRDLRLVPVRPGIVYGTYRYRVRYGDDEQSGLSERLFVETAAGWKIAVTTAFAAPPGTPPPPVALAGATLIDGRGGPAVPDAVVVTRGGFVECAGPRAACPVPGGVETVDARGSFVVPGLVDTHVHFSQTGWADGRPDAIDVRDAFPYEDAMRALRDDPGALGRALLCSGITSAFDVGGYPWTTAFAGETAARTDMPRVAATGPLLSTYDHWLNLPGERQLLFIPDAQSATEAVRYVASLGADAVKVWLVVRDDAELAGRREAVLAAGAAAREAGLPLVVHATRLEAARLAVEAGASLLVHSVDDRPVDDALIDAMKAARTSYCPTLTVNDGYVRMREAAVSGTAPAVDDPNGCVDSALRQRVLATPTLLEGRVNAETLPAIRERAARRVQTMRANLARIHGAGIPVVLGTDAGNPLTLHGPSVHAELEAMQASGIAAIDVLLAATRDAARAAGLGEVAGTIEAGRPADLLVVGADPAADIAALRRTTHVMRGGVLRSVSELFRAGAGTAPR